jgi:hypothetical protein
MSGQSWHEITVSREIRYEATASPTKAGGSDEAAGRRLLTHLRHQERLPVVESRAVCDPERRLHFVVKSEE